MPLERNTRKVSNPNGSIHIHFRKICFATHYFKKNCCQSSTHIYKQADATEQAESLMDSTHLVTYIDKHLLFKHLLFKKLFI